MSTLFFVTGETMSLLCRKSVIITLVILAHIVIWVDLNQEYGKFVLFLKNSFENICKLRINALPLHSLSLPNVSDSQKKFFESMTQTRIAAGLSRNVGGVLEGTS